MFEAFFVYYAATNLIIFALLKTVIHPYFRENYEGFEEAFAAAENKVNSIPCQIIVWMIVYIIDWIIAPIALVCAIKVILDHEL